MKKTNILLIIFNIIFLMYYSINLFLFTNEFAIKNLGFFNHAIAGLSEIIAIIFLSFDLTLFLIIRKGLEKQFPIFLTIFLIQILILLNFIRYIYTKSSGETDVESITFNTIIFLLGSINSAIFIIINFKKLY